MPSYDEDENTRDQELRKLEHSWFNDFRPIAYSVISSSAKRYSDIFTWSHFRKFAKSLESRSDRFERREWLDVNTESELLEVWADYLKFSADLEAANRVHARWDKKIDRVR
jgi:hypothetical protein